MHHRREGTVGFLVGTKNDLTEAKAVSTEEGQALADTFGLGFFEVSAKTSENVDELFFQMAQTIHHGPSRGQRLVQAEPTKGLCF